MSDVRQDRDGNLTVKEGLEEIKDNKGYTWKIHDTGLDDDGNTVKIAQRPPQWISPTKLRLSNGKVVSFDPNERCFEVYNKSKSTVYFVNNHYNPREKALTPNVIKILPDEFAFIPHAYYIFYAGFIGNNSGDKLDLIVNYGDMMFKGNKLASRPEKKKIII